jgi:ATP adenylyltransferase
VVGVPDDLERLWTPHRMAYISGDQTPPGGYNTPSGCPFCLAPTRTDEESLIVARGDVVYAILNLYPYNPGHLMICPYRHVADYTDLTEAETVELARFGQTAMATVRRVSGPDGFNLGMNQGRAAGAGIAAHLHQHIVPRWSGDTNFMPVIGRTKTLPQLLGDTRRLLADAWKEPARPARPRRSGRLTAAAAPAPAAASTEQPTGRRRSPAKESTVESARAKRRPTSAS